MVSDHRSCCAFLFPPEDWQTTNPGESWHVWYSRKHGRMWSGFLSACCGWPMTGTGNYGGRCINPIHLEEER